MKRDSKVDEFTSIRNKIRPYYVRIRNTVDAINSRDYKEAVKLAQSHMHIAEEIMSITPPLIEPELSHIAFFEAMFPGDTCVYFLYDTKEDMMKIGRTKNLMERVDQIGIDYSFRDFNQRITVAGHVSASHDVCVSYENSLIKRYKNINIIGEWFDIRPDMMPELFDLRSDIVNDYVRKANQLMPSRMSSAKAGWYGCKHKKECTKIRKQVECVRFLDGLICRLRKARKYKNMFSACNFKHMADTPLIEKVL